MNILFALFFIVAIGCATSPKENQIKEADLIPYAKKVDVDAKMRLWGDNMLKQAEKSTDAQIRSFKRDCGCLSEMK